MEGKRPRGQAPLMYTYNPPSRRRVRKEFTSLSSSKKSGVPQFSDWLRIFDIITGPGPGCGSTGVYHAVCVGVALGH